LEASSEKPRWVEKSWSSDLHSFDFDLVIMSWGPRRVPWDQGGGRRRDGALSTFLEGTHQQTHKNHHTEAEDNAQHDNDSALS
jgi:hypothetical protein